METPENPSLNHGNFRINGSWDPHAHVLSRGPLYAFVRDLVRARRASKLPPSAIAAQIAASSWTQAFPNLQHWLKESRWNHWPSVPASSSAEECVKRCGIGAVDFHWQEGLAVRGDDNRNLPAVPMPEVFKNALDALLASPRSTPAHARPREVPEPTAPEPDEIWFSQHPEALAPAKTQQPAAGTAIEESAVVSQAPRARRGGRGRA